MKPEKRLMNQIRLYCGTQNWIVIRANVGTFQTIDGRFIDTGLPKGWPDLLILTDNGIPIFCETKVGNNKASKEQQDFINLMKSRNFEAFITYNLDDFIQKTLKYVKKNI